MPAAAFADPDLHSELRDGARATALNFGWDYVGSRYIELLEQVHASKEPWSHDALPAGA